jgi:Tfp pilus assembly protein PilN
MTAKIKTILTAAGVALVAIVIGLIMYGQGQKKAYQQDIGALTVLVSQLETKVKLSDTAILAKTNEIIALAKEKQAALDSANAAAQSQAVTQAALDKLKTETAALPPDALSGAINVRIGTDASRPTANGLFSFTRVWAENTLNLFYTGEAAIKQGGEYLIEIAGLRSAVAIAATEIKVRDEKYALRDGEYVALGAAFTAQGDALKHLQNSFFGRSVRTFIIGAATGAAIVILYDIFKPAKAAVAVIGQ